MAMYGPDPRITVYFRSNFPPGRRPTQIIDVPVPASALSPHSGRISLFLASSPGLNLIYTIPGAPQQLLAYRRVLLWLLSCHRSHTYHPLHIPDDESYTSLALLCQAARFLNIPDLQQATVRELETRVFPATELRHLLTNVSNADDPAVAIAIKSLAAQYVVNPLLQEWIVDFVQNEGHVQVEEWFDKEVENLGFDIPRPDQVPTAPSGTLRGGVAPPPLQTGGHPDTESAGPSRHPTPPPPAPTPPLAVPPTPIHPPAVPRTPVVIHQAPRSPTSSIFAVASDATSRRPLLDGDRRVRRRWSGDGKELVRVKKKRTQGRRPGGSEEVIYLWLWRFAT